MNCSGQSNGSRAQIDTFLRWQTILLALLSWSTATGQEIEAQKAAVVKIQSQVVEGEETRTRIGTGFVIRVETDAVFIVTASHVVEGDKHPSVEFYANRNKPVKAEVLRQEAADPRGLAALVVRGRENMPVGLTPLPLAPADTLGEGDDVTAIGFPQGVQSWAVSKCNVNTREGRDILFSGSIEEGSSGGPLIREGKVVGVVVGLLNRFGVAVPVTILEISLKGWGIKPESPPRKVATSVPAGDTKSDEDAWQGIESSVNPNEYQAYLNQFPSGTHVSEARTRWHGLTALRVLHRWAESIRTPGAKWKKPQTAIIRGMTSFRDLKAEFQLAFRQNKFVVVLSFEGNEVRVGRNGATNWSWAKRSRVFDERPDLPKHLVGLAAQVQITAQAIIHYYDRILGNLPDMQSVTMTAEDKKKLTGAGVILVEQRGDSKETVVDAQDVKLHFSSSSGRLLGITALDAQGGFARIEFDMYRPIRGILMPHRLVVHADEAEVPVSFSEIIFDPSLNDEIFEQPR
jgi:hypothetical protein